MRWWSLRDSRPRRRWDGVSAGLSTGSSRGCCSARPPGTPTADVSSAVASGADIAPGVHGYDPTNPNDPSRHPCPTRCSRPAT